MLDNFIGIVLAAGKGTRLKVNKINKVMLELAGKPMISYTLEILKKAGLKKIIIVVGFAKDSIIKYFGNKYVYIEQSRRLGTAHALKCALPKIPANYQNLFVCYSDDTAFYPIHVIKNLLKLYLKEKPQLALLTIIKDNPFGLGRIIRDKDDKITGIIEEKDATVEQKKIKEINTGCYCFNIKFLKKYLPKISKNKIKNEYYLTDIVGLAIKAKEKVSVLTAQHGCYFEGINTKDQLINAQMKMQKRFKNE